MTRRQAAVADLPEFQCLLCGAEAETYVDLCDRCNAAFHATAERVAAAILAAHLPAGVTVQVEQVPGQLTLDGAAPRCERVGDGPDWGEHTQLIPEEDDWAGGTHTTCLRCGQRVKFRVRANDRPPVARILPHRIDGTPTR